MLRVDAALDRMSAEHHRMVDDLVHFRARRNHDLRLHQVHVGGHLRHRMLHLNARVHLDKVQAAVLVHQEFNGPGVHIANLRQRFHQNAANSVTQLLAHTTDGASSTSFWCRRWMLHSRSPKVITFPCSSASTWNSMCRGRSMNFSMYRSPLPKAAAASDCAA